ncbi:MAG: maleylpyruvate isomerase family mycothiol-dependent enzyme [Acidimicrobiia bacterium]
MLDHAAAIRRESERIATVVAAAPLDTPVPSCPGWALRDLVAHLGEVQRFWAANIHAAHPHEPAEIDWSAPSDADAAPWLREGTMELLTAIAGTPPDERAWVWWDGPGTAGAISRHQVQEAAVHRWDVEAAIGTASPLATDLAVDGVSEFLAVMVGDRTGELDRAVTLTATEVDESWTVGAGRATAEVRAVASSLVLLLYRRIGPTDVVVTGDGEAVVRLLAAAGTE